MSDEKPSPAYPDPMSPLLALIVRGALEAHQSGEIDIEGAILRASGIPRPIQVPGSSPGQRTKELLIMSVVPFAIGAGVMPRSSVGQATCPGTAVMVPRKPFQ